MILLLALVYVYNRLFCLMRRRPPTSTQGMSSAASNVYKSQPSYSLAREYVRELHLELREAIATITRVRLVRYGVGHLAQIRDIKSVSYSPLTLPTIYTL